MPYASSYGFDFQNSDLYREFDITAYSLISNYRGSLQAFFWQNLSKLYEGNLKSIFNPNTVEEDFYIDQIIKQYFNE